MDDISVTRVVTAVTHPRNWCLLHSENAKRLKVEVYKAFLRDCFLKRHQMQFLHLIDAFFFFKESPFLLIAVYFCGLVVFFAYIIIMYISIACCICDVMLCWTTEQLFSRQLEKDFYWVVVEIHFAFII
jgi:hypothetical protein